MNETPEKHSFDYYRAEWRSALARDDFEQALSFVLDGYKLSRSRGDELQEKNFLSYLKMTADYLNRLMPQSNMHNNINKDFKSICSFCGKSIGESPHVLGANVSICAECIRLALKIIEKV